VFFQKEGIKKIEINKSSQKPLVFTALNLAKPFMFRLLENLSVFHGFPGWFPSRNIPKHPQTNLAP